MTVTEKIEKQIKFLTKRFYKLKNQPFSKEHPKKQGVSLVRYLANRIDFLHDCLDFHLERPANNETNKLLEFLKSNRKTLTLNKRPVIYHLFPYKHSAYKKCIENLSN